MITFDNVSLQRGAKLLFSEVSVAIFAKQKIGIVGANGSGKSSLLGLILGEYISDAGNIKIQSDIKIAHLSQEIPNTSLAAIDYVIQGDKALSSVLKEIEVAEENNDMHGLSHLHSVMYDIDGYSARSRAAKLLHGLGFQVSEYEKAVNEFSGGWRMRLNLAQTLMCKSDLLLLDEPTNHLDLGTIVWLENWLKNYNGALLLISHDREFLDNVVEQIFHLDNQKITCYTGNYSGFEELRAMALTNQQSAYQKQQAKTKHLMEFVNRFRAKASKAKQAQSRLKAIEKLEKIAAVQVNTPFTFKFKPVAASSASLIDCRDISFAYDEKPVLSEVSLSINSGDRIGLLGLNGAGKSTLIKILAKISQPQSGTVTFNKTMKIGYFAQHQVDQLDLSSTAFQQLRDLDSTLTEQRIRTFLGGFNFKNDAVFMPITNFSGGEKARLALALLIWQAPDLLLLDEPTNHLDLEMREAIVMALQDYNGAMVLVSHDRNLLRTSVDQFLLVADHNVSVFTGDLDDYKTLLLKKNDGNNVERKVQPDFKTTTPVGNTKQTGLSKNKQKMLEMKLQELYQEQQQIEATLADPMTYTQNDRNLAQEYVQKLEQIKIEIGKIEHELLLLY